MIPDDRKAAKKAARMHAEDLRRENRRCHQKIEHLEIALAAEAAVRKSLERELWHAREEQHRQARVRSVGG